MGDLSTSEHAPGTGTSVYKQIVMLMLGSLIVTSFGIAGWLLRAEHDDVKATAKEALDQGRLNREQIAVLRSQMDSVNKGMDTMLGQQGVIIANQAAILKKLP